MESPPSVYQIFTPSTPARLCFVEREEVNNNLVSALRTPGKQIVVYGHTGSGKSTLINKSLERLYERHVTSRCMHGMTFDQLVLDAFDQLEPFYISETSSKTASSIGGQLGSNYFMIKNQLSVSVSSEQSGKSQRALPIQLTLQNLARFMGEAKSCWILEDFHKIAHQDRTRLSQAMKVFVDMASEYNDLKIIAIGAVDSARQVVEYDAEMRTRVAEIHVPLMDLHELQQIIVDGTKMMNVRFDSSLSSTISHYAAGLPSICHSLCLNICFHLKLETPSEGLRVVTKDALQPALKMYLANASDTLKLAFEQNLKQTRVKKFNNAELIVKALSQLPQEGGTRADIYNRISKDVGDYPQGNLTKYLKQMCELEKNPLIRSSASSGKYAFVDPLYRAFAMALYANEEELDEKIDLDNMIAEFIRGFSTETLTKFVLSAPKIKLRSSTISFSQGESE